MLNPEGHRARLKAKFADGQGVGLADYELLELALTYAIPRKDTKPLAKALLERFGSLSGVLAASPAELEAVDGLGPSSVMFINLMHQLSLRTRQRQISATPVFANRVLLLDYLYTLFAGKTREELHVLYVDSKLKLIKNETLFMGTLTHTAASPRDIIKRALELNAAGFILAHNHPSGNPSPSADDHTFTATLQAAASALNLALHDHLIIGADNHYSFKGAGKL